MFFQQVSSPKPHAASSRRDVAARNARCKRGLPSDAPIRETKPDHYT